LTFRRLTPDFCFDDAACTATSTALGRMTSSVPRERQWLPIEQRITYKLSIIMHVLTDIAPEYISDLVTRVSVLGGYVWNISYRTHCNILPLLSNFLPMYDEICKRTVNFIKSCLNCDCVLVNRLTYRGIHFEQM